MAEYGSKKLTPEEIFAVIVALVAFAAIFWFVL